MSPDRSSQGTLNQAHTQSYKALPPPPLRRSCSANCPKSPSGLSQEQPNQALKNPRLQSSAASPSAIVIANNEDLLTEIFLKLRPKSLLRYKLFARNGSPLSPAPPSAVSTLGDIPQQFLPLPARKPCLYFNGNGMNHPSSISCLSPRTT